MDPGAPRLTMEILLIDKPVGISSFDVIRRLRHKLGKVKMGHAGTLDPLASGLMIIGIGAGTKKLNEYLKLDKEYEAEVLVGRKTTTGDREGEIIEEKAVERMFSSEEISETLKDMVGTLKLPVSAYSAIKKDGVPFYKKARAAEKRGETVPLEELPVREMKVYKAELIGQILNEVDQTVIIPVRFGVGSGTYIRSLAEELGRRLGYPATLQSLRRTKIGEFEIKDAEAV